MQTMQTTQQYTLTDKQKDFLRDYLPELDDGVRSCLANQDADSFTKAVLDLDFDDGEPANTGRIKTAKALFEKGLLSEIDIHTDRAGNKHIYCCFSESGALALFELGCENVIKNKPLRLT